MNPVEKDNELKRKAIENIFNNKKKFLNNWVANVSRLFLSYPLSFLKPSIGILYYLVPNMFLVVLSFLSFILTLIRIKVIPYEILFLLAISFIYLFGISLLASYARFLYLILPILLVWNGLVINKYVKINLKLTKPKPFANS